MEEEGLALKRRKSRKWRRRSLCHRGGRVKSGGGRADAKGEEEEWVAEVVEDKEVGEDDANVERKKKEKWKRKGWCRSAEDKEVEEEVLALKWRKSKK